jgi:hypothetical protein
MPDAVFPKPVAEVLSTLAEIFRHQGQREINEVLESAHARFDEIDYDNWNGGTYTWALRLEIPVPMFAALEQRLTEIEKEIGAKLNHITRLFPSDHIGEVTLTPLASGSAIRGERMAPSELEVLRLWPDGRFRLFLSHVSEHKIAVSKLKDQLALRGVAGFVAHEDIEPSLEWRNEIELGLRSMHALAALVTPDFHASLWTDQEIGWAFGRGVLVVPVRLGVNPYGFAGKHQGVPGTLEQPADLATSIVKALLVNSQTCGEMRRGLVAAFSEANSFDQARTLSKLLIGLGDFTADDKSVLWKACAENTQIAGAFGVVKSIHGAIGTPPPSMPLPNSDEIPF